MAVNIGPKIGIDGEAEFRKELLNLNQQVKTFGAELKAIASAAEDESNALEKSQRSYETLSRLYSTQEKKLEKMNRALEESTKIYGESDNKTLKWKQAVYEATTQLNKLEAELKDSNSALDQFGREAGDAADNLDNMVKETKNFGSNFAANLGADVVADAISSILSGLKDMVEETKEYRKIMASLEVSSEMAGYTAEETAEAYQKLYGVLADDQTAATTVANLQAIGLGQEDLNKMIDAAIGAWATYGDSIPIDGLAEALNETIRTGEVTGNLADVLNWAGVNEEKFNEQLAAAKTDAEKANIVLQALADQGLMQAGQAWQENNKSLIAANQATANYTDAMAKIAEQVEPVFTSLQNAFTSILGLASGMMGAINFEGVAAQIGSVTEYLTGLITSVQTGEMTVGEAFRSITDNFVGMLTDLVSRAAEQLPSILQIGTDIVMNVLQGITDNFPEIVNAALDLIVNFIDGIIQSLPNVLDQGIDIVMSLIDGLIDSLPDVTASAIEIITTLGIGFLELLPKVAEWGIEILGSLLAGLIKAVGDIPGTIQKISEAIKKAFDKFDWKSIGTNMLKGIANGITSGVSTIINAAKTAAQNALNAAKNALGIHSPSTVFRDEIGKNMMLGMAGGLTKYTGLAETAAKRASGIVAGAFGAETAVPRFANGTAAAYDRMAASMGNLRVVLNDGTLVGKIAPRMDQTLGGYTKVKARYGV